MNKEIQRIEFFIPGENIRKMISADEAFASFSERGIEPDFSHILNPYRYFQLREAKRRQGITMGMWEEGIGIVPYWVLLGGESPEEILPKDIVDFMKKEMFKGVDSDLIEKTYQEVLIYWNWWRKLLFYLKDLYGNSKC